MTSHTSQLDQAAGPDAINDPDGVSGSDAMDGSDAMEIVVCVKWADLRAPVDPLSGLPEALGHSRGLSMSDRAAVEVALRLRASTTSAATVTAATVGPEDADQSLRDLVAVGVDRVLRVDAPIDAPSDEIAAALAEALRGRDPALVVCGDVSADRGSGSVPAFLAHRLDAAQALGLIDVAAEVAQGPMGELSGLRRLDGGRRERLRVALPAVISVEGAAADLRRASLGATLSARDSQIEVCLPSVATQPEQVQLRPWRPRSRELPAPSQDTALGRIIELTGALVERTPPRVVTLDPPEAAALILEQLREWGYLDDGA